MFYYFYFVNKNVAFIFSVLKAVINCSIRSSAFASSQDSSPPKTEKLKLKLCLKLNFKLYLKLLFKPKLKLTIQEMDPRNCKVDIPEGMLRMMIAQKVLELQALTNALESCDESPDPEPQDTSWC